MPGGRNGVTDARQLDSVESVAALLLALGPGQAGLWDHFDESEVLEITQAMSRLGTLKPRVVESVLGEFISRLSGGDHALSGSLERTERLLAAMLPEDKVGQLMEEIRGPAGRTFWEKLSNVNETVLAGYLRGEYPQTTAVVLSKISLDHAARVLAALPEDFAVECITRMLRMEPVQRDIINEIENTLRTEFMSNISRTSKRDAHEAMAEIFNAFDRSTEERFLAGLHEINPTDAERIRSLMFVFEDLVTLDPGGIQTLLRAVDKPLLSLALKGASDTVRDLFFANMSERGAKILRDDLQSRGPVRLREVEHAQTAILDLVKDLVRQGEIVLSDSRGDERLVY